MKMRFLQVHVWTSMVATGLLVSQGARAGCFDYQSTPLIGPTQTVQVSVMSRCSIGSCPRRGAIPPTCTVSATVEGQEITKYTASGSFAAGDFGLSAGWEQATVTGSSGTAQMSWSNWCEAHNADTAKTFTIATVLYWTTCDGQIISSSSGNLETVSAYFARAPGDPDAPQPDPCNPACPGKRRQGA